VWKQIQADVAAAHDSSSSCEFSAERGYALVANSDRQRLARCIRTAANRGVPRRWSTWQCNADGIDCDESENVTQGYERCCDDARVPKTIQDRAWTSPIGYTP
jgi:hypothetical protein